MDGKGRLFLMILLVTTLLGMIFVGVNVLWGQKMDEERMMKLLREFVALEPYEVPEFDTRGGVTFRNTDWGVVDLILAQKLHREGKGIPGRDPTEIFIRLHYLPDLKIAYQVALSEAWTQRFFPGTLGPTIPEGSWTGMPIGEKSWCSGICPEGTKPAPGLGSAILVVWDDKLALRVEVHYQPLGGPKAKTAIFLPVAKEDLELGELAARLILAKANLLLWGWRELPTVRLVANGKNLEAKKTKKGAVFVPVQALLKELGGKAERKLGVIEAFWRGKKVTLPIGARVMLVGKEKVRLSLPVLLDRGEAWVDAAGMAKGLGLAMRWEKGQLMLAKR
jgi:hypothetical protein